MPTNIDPSTAAVLAVDLQEEVIDHARTNGSAEIRRSARALAVVARTLSLPTLFSTVPVGPEPPRVIEELRGEMPEALAHVRRTAGALGHPDTVRWLKRSGRKVVAICGVTAEVAVLHSALAALDAGYAVHVLVDASGGLTARGEQAAFRQIEIAGGLLASVPSFATALASDFSSPQGRAVAAALQSLLR